MKKKKEEDLLKDDPSISIYFRDIAVTKGLSYDREAELAHRIKKGDKAARDELIKSNLRFVVSVARGYQNQGLPLADLINEGNLGLIRAAERFDAAKNFKFISYAVWWIRQAILQALAEQSRVVKVPTNRIHQIFAMRKQQEVLEQKQHRVPQSDELQSAMGIKNIQDLEKLRTIDSMPVFLDAPLDNQVNTLLDSTQDPNAEPVDKYLEKHYLKKQANQILGLLRPRDREICERYFGFNGHHEHTLEEIGVSIGITRERVRQIKDRAFKMLRKSTKLKEFSRER